MEQSGSTNSVTEKNIQTFFGKANVGNSDRSEKNSSELTENDNKNIKKKVIHNVKSPTNSTLGI